MTTFEFIILILIYGFCYGYASASIKIKVESPWDVILILTACVFIAFVVPILIGVQIGNKLNK